MRSGGVWTQQQKLTASDAAAGDQFGYSVSVSDDMAVVGDWGDDDGGSSSGSAYVFTRAGGVWTQQQKLTASDAAASDAFGGSVAIDTGRVAVGAFRNDDPETDSGAAYVFSLIPDAEPTTPTATVDSSSQITWGWSDNSSNESGFKVWSNAGSADPVTLRTTAAASATSWTQTSLTANTQYAMQAAATNAYGDTTRTLTLTAWTLAAVPAAPVVNNPTITTLDVAIGAGDGNSTPTQYAIYCSTTSQWVQSDGTLGASEAWQTASAWGTKTVTGLAEYTNYSFAAKTRNGERRGNRPRPERRGTNAGSDPAHIRAVGVGGHNNRSGLDQFAIHGVRYRQRSFHHDSVGDDAWRRELRRTAVSRNLEPAEPSTTPSRRAMAFISSPQRPPTMPRTPKPIPQRRKQRHSSTPNQTARSRRCLP